MVNDAIYMSQMGGGRDRQVVLCEVDSRTDELNGGLVVLSGIQSCSVEVSSLCPLVPPVSLQGEVSLAHRGGHMPSCRDRGAFLADAYSASGASPATSRQWAMLLRVVRVLGWSGPRTRTRSVSSSA
jgi:hypothetical protein